MRIFLIKLAPTSLCCKCLYLQGEPGVVVNPRLAGLITFLETVTCMYFVQALYLVMPPINWSNSIWAQPEDEWGEEERHEGNIWRPKFLKQKAACLLDAVYAICTLNDNCYHLTMTYMPGPELNTLHTLSLLTFLPTLWALSFSV